MLEAHARSTDPSTSKAAARTVNVDTHLYLVWQYLTSRAGWLATFDREQLVDALRNDMSAQSARSRLSELMQAGYVKDTGTRRKTASGRSQQVLIPSSSVLADNEYANAVEAIARGKTNES